MNIISSDTKITKKISVCPKEMILPSFLKNVRQLIEEQKNSRDNRYNFILIKA